MQRILITGANRGIGFEMTRQYLQQTDALLFVTARQPRKASALHDLKNDFSDRLHIIPLEVTDAESIQAAIAMIGDYTISIDVLINNAGIDPAGQAFHEITPELMLEVLTVNTVAPMMMAQAAYPLLKASAQPHIVHISSSMGSLAGRTYGGNYGYCSSKAGLNMAMRGMAADLGKEDFIVIALDPGWVRTDMGGQQASLTPEESATGIIQVISNLMQHDNGRYLMWNGDEQPW